MTSRMLNVVLTYKTKTNDELRLQGASCIRIDGMGMTLIHPETGTVERIPLDAIEVLSIQAVSGYACRPAAA